MNKRDYVKEVIEAKYNAGKKATSAAIIAVLVVLIVSGLYLQSVDDKILVEVQTGQKALYCHMADGYRQIEASKVTGFDGVEWKFVKGGSAKSCSIK